MLEKHYSPRARLVIAEWKTSQDAAGIANEAGGQLERTRVIAYHRIPAEGGFAAVAVVPEDAEAYARALYAELHRCDEAGAELILVEAPPEGAEWEGVRDRLKRAAAK
jgi:L-threonylcarbamoyladenylate synthase